MIAAALVGPIVALPLAWRAPDGSTARRWVAGVALADSALWLLVLFVDPAARVGRFGAGAAPVAIGTWLLLASITWPPRRWPLALTVLAAGTCVGGASLLTGGGDLGDASGALALAAVLVTFAARSEGDRGLVPAAACMAGAAVLAIGFVQLENDTGSLLTGGGTLVAVGAAVTVVAAGQRARRAGIVLLPLALVLGAQADAASAAAVVFAIAAVMATDRPGVSLGLWALAVATVSPPAALLVGVGAVVASAWLHPLAVLAALPGAAAVFHAAAQDSSPGRVALALLAAATAARLWPESNVEVDLVEGTPAPSTLAAIVLAAWLLLAPETWGWAAAPGLESWGTGVLYASGAAAVGAFVVASFTDATFSLPTLEVADPSYRPGQPRWAGAAVLVSLLALGACGALLITAVVS